MEPKKKSFPKTKKKIRGFLTDESVGMSKKSVLGLALGSMLLYTGINEANAGHSNISTVNESISPALATPISSTITNTVYASATASCPAKDFTVNGHYSSTPT